MEELNMETSQTCSYAFIDNNDTVMAVLLFDEGADEALLTQVKEKLNAVEAILCDDDNQLAVGYTKIDNKYYPPKPGESFVWSEEYQAWVELEV